LQVAFKILLRVLTVIII